MRNACILAATLILATAGCKPTVSEHYTVLTPIGDTVPDFSYPRLDGTVLSADTLRGYPTVLALWSSDCAASRASLASLRDLNVDCAPRGVRIVVLADDSEPATVVPLMKGADLNVPVALAAGTLMDTFTRGQSILPWRKAFAHPTFLVLDASGRVVYQEVGLSADPQQRLVEMRSRLDYLIGEPS